MRARTVINVKFYRVKKARGMHMYNELKIRSNMTVSMNSTFRSPIVPTPGYLK